MTATETAAAAQCSECERLREELAKTRESRDEALLEMAKARELANALRLSFGSTTEQVPPPPPGVTPGLAPPLRYVLVDRANNGMKKLFGPVHGMTKKVVKSALKLLAP